MLCIAEGSVAYAELLNCTVGDESKGGWIKIPSRECLYPGPPAAGSPWPTSVSDYALKRPYHIEGRYKTAVRTMSNVWDYSPPPDRPKCITGFAEAYTPFFRESCQSNSDPSVSTTSSGNLITVKYNSPPTCNPSPPYNQKCPITWYIRFFENAFYNYEWKCFNPPETPVADNNAGPPCPPDQCCNN
jgi:hypothetical protein